MKQGSTKVGSVQMVATGRARRPSQTMLEVARFGRAARAHAHAALKALQSVESRVEGLEGALCAGRSDGVKGAALRFVEDVDSTTPMSTIDISALREVCK